MSDNQQSWRARFIEAVQVFRNPAKLLRTLPPISDEIPLKELVHAFRSATHGTGTIEGGLRELGSVDRRETLRKYLVELRDAIVGRLQQSGSDENAGLVRTREFSGGKFTVAKPTELDGPSRLSGVYLDVLPADHWLHDLLDSDQFYQTERAPALILGPLDRTEVGGWRHRSFYMIEHVTEWTKELRRHQREKEHRERAKKERERRQAERQSELSPSKQAAEIRRLKAELAELKASQGIKSE